MSVAGGGLEMGHSVDWGYARRPEGGDSGQAINNIGPVFSFSCVSLWGKTLVALCIIFVPLFFFRHASERDSDRGLPAPHHGSLLPVLSYKVREKGLCSFNIYPLKTDSFSACLWT